MPRTKPDKYTIIYTLSETCISYLVPRTLPMDDLASTKVRI